MRQLIILGNGFDLFFDLKTKYKDFFNYLNANYPEEKAYIDDFALWDNIEDSSLWMDFESNLGNINLFVLDDFRYDIEELKNLYCELENVKDLLKTMFVSWVKSINCDIDKQKYKKYCFNNDAFLLTFNYTLTVEKHFKINPLNIYHIHGSIDDEIVFGHASNKSINNKIDEYRELFTEESLEEFPPLYEDSLHVANDFIYALEKPTKKIIKKLNKVLEVREINLHDIEEVIIIGHSYSEVDFPYFQLIAKKCKKANWFFGVHSTEDEKKAQQYIMKLNIPHYQVVNSDTLIEKTMKNNDI